MPPSPVDIGLRPTNTARVPDWRWQLAAALCERGKYDFPDPVVREAINYISLQNSLDEEHGDWDLYESNPTLFDTHEIYKVNLGSDILDRWQIEARILAGQTNEEIHSRTGYTIPVIRMYESLFFDVRSRLQHSDFVTSHILGRQIHVHKNMDLEPLMKLLGWVAGPTALDWFLNKGRGHTASEESSDPSRRLDAVFSRTTRLRAVLSSYSAPMYGEMHGMNFETYSRLRDTELKAQVIGVQSANEELLRGFYQAVSDFQFQRATEEKIIPLDLDDDPFLGQDGDPVLIEAEAQG